MKIKRIYFKDAIYISAGEAVTTLEPEKPNSKVKIISTTFDDAGLMVTTDQARILIPVHNIRQVIYDPTPEANLQGISKKAERKAGVSEPISN